MIIPFDREHVVVKIPLCVNIYLFQPALVVLSHEPKGATQTVAWVGKGIVYDTGGLSIKVSHKDIPYFKTLHKPHHTQFCLFVNCS